MPEPVSRRKQLLQIAGQFPVANQQVATGLESARRIELAGALAPQAPGAPGVTPQTTQALGAAAAQQAGQQQLKLAQQQAQQLGVVGKMGVEERAGEAEARVARMKESTARQAMGLRRQLADIDENVANQLTTVRTQFVRDEAGRALWQESQLADHQASMARNAEEFKNWEQRANQAHTRRMQVLKTARAKVEQELQHELAKKKQDIDQNKVRYLANLDRQAKEKEADAKKKAAGSQAIWGGIGTVAGAAAGAAIGTVLIPGLGTAGGAVIGAQLGGAAGSGGGQSWGWEM